MSLSVRRLLATAAVATLAAGAVLVPPGSAGAAPATPDPAAAGPGAVESQVADISQLVPGVQQWQAADGTFTLDAGARIVRGAEVPKIYTDTFADDLGSITGQKLPVAVGSDHPGDIVLRVDPTLQPGPVTAGDAAQETYRIVIDERITVTGISPAAVARGMQTLEQLFTLSPGRRTLATGTIDDWPKAGDRGVMLDAGRHFYQIAYIKQLIREMAWLKLNTLHLHLTEWNGFRLNSPKFPGLAADQSYSRADIAGIEAEAAKYGIEILPEIDLPAHSTAITTIWPELNWSCTSMGTMFGTPNYTLDVTKPETLSRTKELLDEFIPWFSGPRFHIGTDEYPTDGAQKACPELVNYAKAKGYGDTADVFVHYIDDVNEIVRAHGKTTVAWDWWRHDQHPTVDINKNITVESWTNDGDEFIRDGYQVLVSWSSHFYVTPGPPPGGSLQPNTSWFADEFQPRTEPNIVGYTISRWSDNAESQTDSYFDWFAERPQQVLADRSWGAPSTATAFDIEDRIDRLGPPPGQPWRSQPDAKVLTGTVFASGPPWDAAGDPAHGFDGDPASYVDLNEDAGYVGIDLGAGNASSVTAVRLLPRPGSGLGRMVGGTFQGCTDGPDSGCHDLATIGYRTPNDWLQVPVTDDTGYRWLRYRSPAGGHTNVAEIQFLAPPTDAVLRASITTPTLTALGRNEFSVTVRNATAATVTHPKITVLAVGLDSSARRTVKVTGPAGPIRPGATLTVRGTVALPLGTPGELIRLQATVTAEAGTGLMVARASANPVVPAPLAAAVSPDLAPATAGTATAAVTVTNRSASPVVATIAPQPADGAAVIPKTAIAVVPAGRSVERSFRITVPTEPGIVAIPVSVTARAQGQRVTIDPKPLFRVSTPYPDLASARNTHGMTDDADPAPADLAGGIDGDGSSYSWQALADAGVLPGSDLAYGGYRFAWPERSAVDSVIADRQVITVGDNASGVGFLTTGAWGTVSGTGTIRYTDGSSTDFRVSDPDWQTPNLPAGTAVALALPYHNLAGTGRITRTTYVYFHDVPADPSKTIADVTLPGSDQGGRYHVAVFAMALKQ
ncbi:family 20 glycosylhydrolase [Nakamurella lactea]|uniref:family 20 glycosylhydrolase n=1 Tax=Nakamurella lactea TaxID=459515 RepID=UPI00048BFD5A|nr:family 20 glycosylhydrolase [Nakamurella lactea]